MSKLGELEEARHKRFLIAKLLQKLGQPYSALQYKKGFYTLRGMKIGRTRDNVISNLRGHNKGVL
jgi:hypothetical protein